MDLVVLVTGGSGFIGSHVVDALIGEQITVRVLDKTQPLNNKAEWCKGDLLSPEELHDAAKDVETVFHLAAISDVNVSATDPELCLRVNELGTLNLLRACSGRDIEHFVLASTVWAYGRTLGIVTEESPIPPPNDIYTKTKIGQEHLTFSWCQMHSLPYTILRYDIPYGPRMRANMAIANFVRRAIRKQPITIYGDGKQGRCWIFVDDLAQAHCLVMSRKAENETINLAGKEFVTISDIVAGLSKTFGDIPIKHEPPRASDFVGVRTSIEKASRILGWTPATSFTQGLDRYVQSVLQGER
jgi:UDP-glucose 4-epimerase